MPLKSLASGAIGAKNRFPQGGPHGQTESGGIVLAVICWSAPRGGVTRQGVVLTDLQSLLDCQQNLSLSLSLSLFSRAHTDTRANMDKHSILLYNQKYVPPCAHIHACVITHTHTHECESWARYNNTEWNILGNKQPRCTESWKTRSNTILLRKSRKKDSDAFAGQNSALLLVSQDSDTQPQCTQDNGTSTQCVGVPSFDTLIVSHRGCHTFAPKPSLQAP
jgi:hypothetical protein